MHTHRTHCLPRVSGVGPGHVRHLRVGQHADDEPAYSIALLSEHGGTVQTSAGFGVETTAFDQRSFDTLLVMGDNLIRPVSPGMVEFLRSASRTTRRLGSICTGAIALAEAGLLDGRRATTHWCHAPALQKAYPKVKVEEDRIFINDGNIWTAAGMSACVDLALALVEKDLGAEVARRVARQLVVYHRRAGGQSQFSVMLELEPKTDRIQAALTYAKQNLKSALSVEELASAANLSPRQFSRVFHAETGQSPAKAIENLRVEAARSDDGNRSAPYRCGGDRYRFWRSGADASGVYPCVRPATAGDSARQSG